MKIRSDSHWCRRSNHEGEHFYLRDGRIINSGDVVFATMSRKDSSRETAAGNLIILDPRLLRWHRNSPEF
jgi:hypothetical protein